MTKSPGVRAAAYRLGQHPQDHGWRELYRLIAHGLADGRAPTLAELVSDATARRPAGSEVHLVTLLGIAVQAVAGDRLGELLGETGRPAPDRLATLEELLARHRAEVAGMLVQRQNSFTGTRRFLIPQVLLASYFRETEAVFADLGTGLGILPRQLNSRTLFERYVDDLEWPDGRPAYQEIPFKARHGVDRGPMPDLAWVWSCYGPSDYYSAEFRELAENLREVQSAEVHYHELDLTDRPALTGFLTEHEINAVNLCYTLYQLQPTARAGVLGTLAEALREPGLVIVTEPHDDLTRPGCTVAVRDHVHPALRPVCTVSDGHFRGRVSSEAAYRDFFTGGVDAAPRGHAAG